MLLLRTIVFWKGGSEWISIRSGWLWELLAEQEVKGNLRLGIARLLLHLFKLDRLIGVLRLRCHRFKDYGIFQKISTSTSRQIKTFRLFPLYFNEILSNLCKKIFSANIVGRFCRLDFLLEVFHLGEWKKLIWKFKKDSIIINIIITMITCSSSWSAPAFVAAASFSHRSQRAWSDHFQNNVFLRFGLVFGPNFQLSAWLN